ncbi:MAG: T9SS type B sorting domain-containing protein [Cytophagales bacterium]|nr:T9SS type B sorting domain-containing protein [Cytophagales bacterium]
MRLKHILLSISLLLISFLSLAQPDVSQNCPSYSCVMYMDTNTYYHVEGEIHLGQGIVTRDNSGSGKYNKWRSMDYRIPCNRPTWAIAMAHGWQLYRNIFKIEQYDVNTFSGIIINETSGGACDADLDFSCYTRTIPEIPFQKDLADFKSDLGGLGPHDGCYQIDGQGRNTLKEWYGATDCGSVFASSHNLEELITGASFETATLGRVYYDLAFTRRIQFALGTDPRPVLEQTNDPLGLYRLVAKSFNKGQDATSPVAERVFINNRNLAITSNNWSDPALIGFDGYAEACVHYVKVLNNTYVPKDANDLQSWHSWYDYDIDWALMTTYMDKVFELYELTPAEDADIRAKIKVVFDRQKDANGFVSFRYKLGPVIDEMVKIMPYYDPTYTVINSQMGNAGCKGCVGPVVRITPKIPTTVCNGQSVELETVVGSGYSYYWMKDGVEITNNNKDKHIFFAEESGEYDVIVTDNKGCSIQADGAVKVTVNQCSSCDLSATLVGNLNSCTGIYDGSIQVNLSGGDYNSGTNYEYTWTLPDGSTTTTNSNVFSKIKEGAYVVEVIDPTDSDCKAFRNIQLDEVEEIYQQVELSDNVTDCDLADITANIIDNPPTNCDYQVRVEGIPDFSGKCWGNSWQESDFKFIVKKNGVSIGALEPLALTLSGACVSLDESFGVNDGDLIEVVVNNRSTLSRNGMTKQFILVDAEGNEQTQSAQNISLPGGQETVIMTTTASCVQPTPVYDFTWSSSPTNKFSNQTDGVNTSSVEGTGRSWIKVEARTTGKNCVLVDSVEVKNTCGGCDDPLINTEPQNLTICQGEDATFTVSATGSDLSYQWYKGTQVLTGETQTTLTITNAATSDAGDYSVKIIEDCGTEVTSQTVQLAFNSSATPAITISANETTICNGTSVDFSITNQEHEGDNPTYQWKSSIQGDLGTNNTLSLNNLADGEKIWVELTSNANCLSTNEASSNEETISVASSLTPSITISANETTICNGTSVDFLITNQEHEGDNPTYQWKSNVQGDLGINNTLSLNNLADGEKIWVELTSNANCLSTNVASSNEETINLASSLTPTITISANETTICNGTSVDFSIANQEHEGDNPTYQWKSNVQGDIGTNNTLSLNNLADGEKIWVELTSNASCLDNNNPVSSNQETIVVTGSLSPSITITSNKTTICANESVNFSITQEENQGTFPTYQWKSSVQGDLGTNNNLNLNNLVDGEVISLELTSDLACVSSPTTTSNDIVINLTSNITPIVAITAITPTAICNGDEVQIEITQQDGSGDSPSFDWLVNGNSSGQTGETFSSSSLVQGDEVSVKMTSSSSCVSSSEDTSNEIEITVGAPTTPTISIKADQSFPICENTSVTFSINNQTNEGNNPTYQWFIGANLESTDPTFTSSSLKDGDVVSLELNVAETCVTTQKVTSNLIPIQTTTANIPTVSIQVTPSTTICDGDAITFSVDSKSFEGTNPNFVWLVNVSEFPAETNETFTSSSIQNNDKVEVKMTSNDNCISQSDVLSNDIVMTVTSSLEPTVSIALEDGSSSNICNGELVEMKVTGSTATTTNTVYTWKINGLDAGQTGETFSSSSLVQGDKITVESSNLSSCANTPTAISNEVEINIISPITPQVGIITNQTGSVCDGEDISFTINPIEVGSNPTYEWLIDGVPTGTTGNTLDNSLVSLVNGNNVSVQLTVAENCVNGSKTTTSNQETVAITPLSTPNVFIDVNTNISCENGVVIASVTSKDNEGNTPTYVWKVNGQIKGGNSETEALIMESTGTKNIQVEMTSNAECLTTTQALSNIIAIDVQSTITPSITNIIGNQEICEGTSLNLQAEVSHSAPTFEWFVDGTSVATGISHTFNNLTGGEEIKLVSGTTNTTCLDPNNNSDEKTITAQVVNPTNPSIVSASGQNIIQLCEGDNETLNIISANGTIRWYQESGVELSNEQGNNSITVTEAGNYFITTTETPCAAQPSNKVSIEIIKKPSITINGSSDFSILEGKTINLEANVQDYTNINWLDTQGNLLKEGTTTYQTTASQSQIIVASAYNTLENCSASVMSNITVIDKVKMPNVFTPNGDGIHDVWEITGIEGYPDAHVQIFTQWGQTVFETYGNYAENPWDGTYNGSDVTIGVFYYVIILNDEAGIEAPMTGEVHVIR